jgi:hypothetical protein
VRSWRELAMMRDDGWYYRQEWECECCGEVRRESVGGWLWRLLGGVTGRV